MKDYYAILEISFGADIAEIKTAYRQLALRYHPDRNSAPGAATRFIEVTEAYEVLRDPERRRRYDRCYEKRNDARTDSSTDFDFDSVYTHWQKESRAKAKADAGLPYELFAKRLASELRLGVSYVPNLAAVLLTGLVAISMLAMMPSMAADGGGAGALVSLLVGLGLSALTVKLINVMRSDYAEDRKRRL